MVSTRLYETAHGVPDQSRVAAMLEDGDFRVVEVDDLDLRRSLGPRAAQGAAPEAQVRRLVKACRS